MEDVLAQFVALVIGFGLGWYTPRRNGHNARK